MHMMFVSFFAADAINSGNWFTLFKVLTLNVAQTQTQTKINFKYTTFYYCTISLLF